MRNARCQVCNEKNAPSTGRKGLCLNCGYVAWYDLFAYPVELWVSIREKIKKAKGDLKHIQKEIQVSREKNNKFEIQLAGLNEELERRKSIIEKLLKRKQEIEEQLSELKRKEQESAWQFNEMKPEIRLNDFFMAHEFRNAKQQVKLYWEYQVRDDRLVLNYSALQPGHLDHFDPRDVLLILIKEGVKESKVIVHAKAGQYFVNLRNHLKRGRGGRRFVCRLQPVLKDFALKPGKYKIALTLIHINLKSGIFLLDRGTPVSQDNAYFPMINLKG